jgi:hypothetical protein
MARNVDWIAIEAQYRAGSPSVNAIAKEFGVDEGTIRNRAKKNGWTRDAEGAKRQIVKSAMSGIPKGVPNSEVRKIIEDEAEQDIADMRDGLAVARACIAKLRTMVEMAADAREVKVIVEANKGAIETIRRIRGLDEAIGAAAPYEDQLKALAGQ